MSFGIPVRNGLSISLLSTTSLSSGRGLRPSLALNFLSGTLDSRITFTRSSAATRVNASGVIESVTANTPRFDYDPVTLAPRGLLAEEQRTNLLLRSEEFDNAAWSKTRSSVTANTTTAPDGTSTADTLTAQAATGNHAVENAVSFTSGLTYAISVYAKAGTSSFLQIMGFSTPFGVNAFANFNLASGAVGTVGSSATASIQSVGNGWYRCVMVATATGTSTGLAYNMVQSATSARNESWTAAGTETIFIWGAQLEAGAFATSYIPTVASQVTRSADVATITGANFSQWFNAAEGTLVVEATTSGDILSSYSSTILDASVTNIIGTDIDSSGAYRLRVTAASVNQALVGVVNPVAANTTYKLAGAYRVNDFAASANGGAVGTDTSGTVPTGLSYLAIGSSSSVGANSWNGHIRSIKYFPTRLSNAQLQALTA